MKRLWMVFDRIMLCSAVVAGFLLLLITLFVSYSVTLRYMRYNPPIWILQFTEYALLWITFLGAAWLLKQEKHIRIDTLVSHLGPRTQRILEIISSLLGAGVCFIIFWFGTMNTMDFIHRGIMDVKGVTVPMYPLFVVIPLGGVMLLIQFIRNLVEPLRALLGRKKE